MSITELTLLISAFVSVVGVIITVRKFPGEWLQLKIQSQKDLAEAQKLRAEAEKIKAEADKAQAEADKAQAEAEQASAESIRRYALEVEQNRKVLQSLREEIDLVKKENAKLKGNLKLVQDENIQLRLQVAEVPRLRAQVEELTRENRTLSNDLIRLKKTTDRLIPKEEKR